MGTKSAVFRLPKTVEKKWKAQRLFADVADLKEIEVDNYRDIDPDRVAVLEKQILLEGMKTPAKVVLETHGSRVVARLIGGGHRYAAVSRLRDRLGYAVAFPVLVEWQTSKEADAFGALIDNDVKQDNVIDRAKGYKRLLNAGMSVKAIAEKVGVDRKTVGDTVAIAEMPADLLAEVKAQLGQITENFVKGLGRAYERKRGKAPTEATLAEAAAEVQDLLKKEIDERRERAEKKAARAVGKDQATKDGTQSRDASPDQKPTAPVEVAPHGTSVMAEPAVPPVPADPTVRMPAADASPSAIRGATATPTPEAISNKGRKVRDPYAPPTASIKYRQWLFYQLRARLSAADTELLLQVLGLEKEVDRHGQNEERAKSA